MSRFATPRSRDDVGCLPHGWPGSPMNLQYSRNWVYIFSTSSAFYNRHLNNMALRSGVYRISKWGGLRDRPEYLTIIDGNVSIAARSVPDFEDQEVTRRFLTSPYSVSYQYFSGASRSKRTATSPSRTLPPFSLLIPFLPRNRRRKAIGLCLAQFPIFRPVNGALNLCRINHHPSLTCQFELWNPNFSIYLLTYFIWTGSIRVPHKELVVVVSPIHVYPPQVFFSLLVLMTWGTDLLEAQSWA